MDKKAVIIDGNNLFTRGYVIARNQRQCPFKFCLTMVDNLKVKFSNHRFVFTFDTTKSKRRLEIFPSYKGKRKSSMTQEDYQAMKDNLNDFIMLIKYSGYPTLEGYGYEADDYIAMVSKMLIQKYIVTIVSTDADMLQLVNDRIKIYDPIKSITISTDNFERIMDIKLRYFLDYKCLLGDKSDNIDGVSRVGEKTAIKYIQLYGSYEDIHKKLRESNEGIDEEKMKVIEKNILGSTDLMERNRQLMDLSIVYSDENLKTIIKQQVASASDNLNKDLIMKLLAQYECTDMIDKLQLFENKLC